MGFCLTQALDALQGRAVGTETTVFDYPFMTIGYFPSRLAAVQDGFCSLHPNEGRLSPTTSQKKKAWQRFTRRPAA